MARRRIAVIGLGKVGMEVCDLLAKRGADVIAIDKDKASIQAVQSKINEAVVLDSTDVDALEEVDIGHVDGAVVTIGENIGESVLTTAILKRKGVQEIWARAISKIHGQILEMVGATTVVYPEIEVGRRIASSILRPEIRNVIDLSEELQVVEIDAGPAVVGKSLADLDFRDRYGGLVIAIRRKRAEDAMAGAGEAREGVSDREELNLPDAGSVIEELDRLVVVIEKDRVDALDFS